MTTDEIVQAVSAESQGSEDRINKIIEESIVPQGIEIPKPDPIFTLSGIPVFTKKSLSLLKGQAKSGKTTVTAWIVSNIIKEGIRVAWFDTEQGLYYASRTQFWVLQISGVTLSENLVVYDLKVHKPGDRIKMIEHVIETTTPDMVIIDGIRDLVLDINSAEESTLITTDLMKWAEAFDCHISCIIHENKGSSHARGHLGSELQNKSEIVLKVSKNEDSQTVCEPEFTRGEPFEAFAFERDGYGLPVLVSYRQDIKVGESNSKGVKPMDITTDTHMEIIARIFEAGEEIGYSDLQVEIRRVYLEYGVDSMGISKSKLFISWYVANGFMDSRKDGTKTKYRAGKNTPTIPVGKKELPGVDFGDEPPF